MPVAVARVTVSWITGNDEVEATSWNDLAAKMKAPQAKKGASAAAQNMKVMNHLGSQGWELVSPQQETVRSTIWTFKRKAKK
jgi:hypothetical protein